MIADPVLDTPAQMTPRERLLLFALVTAALPTRVLEIGSCEGGSTLIIHRALDPSAVLVSIDPRPRWSDATRRELEPRTHLITGSSPESLPAAMQCAGGKFQFALVDGDHSALGVAADLRGLAAYLEPGALVLLHDAHYWRVREGIDAVLREKGPFVDVGLVSVEPTPEGREEQGHAVVWGGLRLLRFEAEPTAGRYMPCS